MSCLRAVTLEFKSTTNGLYSEICVEKSQQHLFPQFASVLMNLDKFYETKLFDPQTYWCICFMQANYSTKNDIKDLGGSILSFLNSFLASGYFTGDVKNELLIYQSEVKNILDASMFSGQLKELYNTIVHAHTTYEKNISKDELYALHIDKNPAMPSSSKTEILGVIKSLPPVSPTIFG